MAMALQIHPDLQSLIPPLTLEEYAQLEANLLAEGCVDPLIVWQETETVLDGHNRLAICEEHDLEYLIYRMSLPDLDAAKAWIIAHQLGRRNLTPEQMSYYRGEQYNLQKRQGSRTDLTSDHTDTKSRNTAQVLAAQHHVSEPTIKRDGAYAAAVETLAAVLGAEARQAILARDLQLTKQDVPLLAALVSASPERAAVVRGILRGPAPVEALHALLRAARCAICHRPLSQPASINRGIGPICAGHGRGGSCPTPAPISAEPSASPPILTEVLDPAPPEPVPTTLQQVATGDFEWYTPLEVLALVREVLGQIDVDPASCAVAQRAVQAQTFYGLDDDGLRQPWTGRVFCNPPYKMPEIARFIGKLCEELDAQRTTEAILLVNAATETDWFQRAFQRADAVCFPDGRLHFVSPTRNGDHPCQGQALLYFGPDPMGFCVVFAALGVSTRVVCAAAAAAQLPLAEAPAPVAPHPSHDPLSTIIYYNNHHAH
jgi:phage N-6-adenine-methyltransferase